MIKMILTNMIIIMMKKNQISTILEDPLEYAPRDTVLEDKLTKA